MNIDKTKTALKVENISEVIRNKNLRSATPFTIEETGKSFYFFDGNKIPAKEFEKKFPVSLKHISFKGENSDRRKNWINDGKSY